MEEKIELKDAIKAGNNALISLNEAKEILESAKKWGTFDLLGGGFFTSLKKKSKIKEAKASLENAKIQLKYFSYELKDLNLDIELGDFVSFADVWFDSFFADLLVQSRIKGYINDVDELIKKIEKTLKKLESKLRSL